MAFLLFTFYMVTDPGTTPVEPRGQIAFGAVVAAAYGVLMSLARRLRPVLRASRSCAPRGAWCSTPRGGRRAARRGHGRLDAEPAASVCDSSGETDQRPIAIVGMACRYPDARSPDELWENVARRAGGPSGACRRSGCASRTTASADRGARRPTYAVEAAVIEGFEFDRVRFRVAGSTFRAADLAHWLALDVAAEALADAGFPRARAAASAPACSWATR